MTPSEHSYDNPVTVRDVAQLARDRLAEKFPFGYYFRDVQCEYRSGVLRLVGQVPTFYLKQVLQSILQNLDGVTQIDNRVDVVSSNGLSSVRQEQRLTAD